jgi:hypothetical protein
MQMYDLPNVGRLLWEKRIKFILMSRKGKPKVTVWKV